MLLLDNDYVNDDVVAGAGNNKLMLPTANCQVLRSAIAAKLLLIPYSSF
jgi:hypothetical protein